MTPEHQSPQDGFNAYLRTLSLSDFKSLGLNQVAYVKQIPVDGRTAYVVHAADGRPLSVHEDNPTALQTARHNELEPVSLQ